MMKKILFLLTLTMFLNADSYLIKYKGITLGKIPNLDTLKDNYLKAKVTNSIVRFMMKKNYFIFYSGEKPTSDKTKFKHDSKKIIFALKQAIESKPKNKDYIIDKDRHITLKCKDDSCKFDYYSKGSHNAMGDIEFKEGKFYRLTEKKSSLEIVKDSGSL